MASLAFSNHPLLSWVCHGDTPCVELTQGRAPRSVENLDELKARGVAVVTKAQVAAAFQVSERTITKMMGRKEIPFFRLGERLVRFRVEEAIKHMEALAGVVR